MTDPGGTDDRHAEPTASAAQSGEEDPSHPSRRRYLGLVAAVGSLGGCVQSSDGRSNSAGGETPTSNSSTTTASTTTGNGRSVSDLDIQFDRVVDAVEDLGLDASGGTAVDDRLEAALSEGTLVRFPAGEYRFDGSVALTGQRIGMLGDGDVTFRPADGFKSLLFDGNAAGLDRVLIQNVDIDIRAADTTAGIRLACDRQFHLEGVRYLGRGTTRSPGGTTSAFLLAIREPDGKGVLRNAVAKKGSRIDGYAGGNGRIGVWVGWSNKGTVRIENCDFREFGNNGTYTSRTPGNVEIVNCYFLNNNASNVRIGGDGSYVENCTVEIDMNKYTGPLAENPVSLNTRGIVVEQGLTKPGPPLPAGAEIRGCTVVARNSLLSQAAVEQSPQARSLLIRDTHIRCDIDGTPAVRRGPPGAIQYRPNQQKPPKPHWTRLRNVRIDGSAAGGAAIDLRRAPGSAVEDCTVRAPGAKRDGIVLAHCPRSVIRGGAVSTSGYPAIVWVDPETSPDRRLFCLDPASTLQRFVDAVGGEDLTGSSPLLQVLQDDGGGGAVCLGLAPDIGTRLQLDDLSGPLRIGIVGHDSGVPRGRLLNELG